MPASAPGLVAGFCSPRFTSGFSSPRLTARFESSLPYKRLPLDDVTLPRSSVTGTIALFSPQPTDSASQRLSSAPFHPDPINSVSLNPLEVDSASFSLQPFTSASLQPSPAPLSPNLIHSSSLKAIQVPSVPLRSLLVNSSPRNPRQETATLLKVSHFS